MEHSALIESCIVQGSESEAEANATLQELFKALSVTERDDVFAIFLEQEFQKWSPFEISWSFSKKLAKNEWIKDWHKSGIKLPAQRFAKDINHIIEAKDVLTRRQWTSILEACLRIGLGSHSLWVSKCNEVLFKITEQVMAGVDVPSSDDIRDQLNTGKGFWAYEQPIGGHNKKLIRGYLYGRIGLNFLLHFCTEKGLTDSKQRPFNSPNDIHDFLKQLKSRTDDQFKSEFRLALDTVLELEPRKLSAKQGIGKNLEEFLRHSMGQRETNERGLENYDQGYVFSRRGAYARAPWILSCGPVLILTLTYCCSCDGTGVRTVKDLCHHLSEYGIKISPDEVSKSKLGISLRTLGLVLDSPDAEGGMVIINPFQTGR